MSSEPRAFLALDLGTATASVALVGRIEGRWRLVGSRAAPASIPAEALIVQLVDRLVAGDPDLMASIGVPEPAAAGDLVRLTARSRPAGRIAVLAGSERTLRVLVSAAARAGWRPKGLSADRADSLEITQLVLDREVETVLLGADDPPGADERARLVELGQLLAAAAWRRPELLVVLAGGAADQAAIIGQGSAGSRHGVERRSRKGDVSGRGRGAAGAAAIDFGGAQGAGDVRNAGEVPGADEAQGADEGPGAEELEGAGELQGSAEIPATGEVPDAGDGAAVETAAAASDEPVVADAVADREGGDGPRSSIDVARAVALSDGTDAPGVVAAHADDGNRDRAVIAPHPVDDRGGEGLRAFLEDLHADTDDARLATARSIGTLADVLQVGIELVEIGHEAGQRVVALPVGEGNEGTRAIVTTATVSDAALVPADAVDDHVDEVLAWTTTAQDRYRLRDRLRELRLAPWSDAAGEGALVRAAAARAAIGRLMRATMPAPHSRRTPTVAPDLLVAAGGAWATVPGPAVALAMADLVRRPGVCQCAIDSGRLLGPLGTIDDEHDRVRVLRDLAGDLLVPLGSVITPQGVRPGRAGGRLTVRDGSSSIDVDLVAGGLQLVDLPPGRGATIDLAFRDPVVLGAKGRRFEVEVTGGLSGLIVDLRDVPLRLPDRAERRRELLGAWQRALWAGLE